MKSFLTVAPILLLACQSQPEPKPTPAQPAATQARPTEAARPKQEFHLSRAGLVGGDTGVAVSAVAASKAWHKKAIHLSYEPGATYRSLLKEVVAPALEAESSALVFHAPDSDLETRVDFVPDTPGIQVDYATLYLRSRGPSFGDKALTLTDDAACLAAVAKQREAWRGRGKLAILLQVVPANQDQPLRDLQRIAGLVVKGGCRPVLHAGSCAYGIERLRFERAMAAETVDERLRLLRAHIKAYPKPPRTSVAFLPFAWEWEGEIYVGEEWSEWTHVRTGQTTEPKFPHKDN